MNYQNSKIYAIRSHQTDNIYIGSTCSPLHKRFYQHKNKYKENKIYYSSFELMKYKDAYIELLEEYPCNNKMELCKKEGEYIRSMDCVNKHIAGRTKEERKEKMKKYYEKNKEQRKEKMKEYYEKNKERISKREKEKIKCVCGSICRKGDIRRHERTQKHIKYIEDMKV